MVVNVLSDVIMSCCISAYSGTSESLFFKQKMWYLMVARKRIHSFEGGLEKSIPLDHYLSSLGKPSDAKRQSL